SPMQTGWGRYRALSNKEGCLRLATVYRMRPSMLTQIYEISTPEETQAICAIGVDHIGILVGKGEFPRELSLETAATIAGMVRPPSKLSALFLATDISLIEKLARKLLPAIIHLG